MVKRSAFISKRLLGSGLLVSNILKVEPPSVLIKQQSILYTHITSVYYHLASSVAANLKKGDPLELRLEPENPFDDYAIAVYAEGYKIGFIPRINNLVHYGHLDIGVELKTHRGSIDKTNPDNPTIQITVSAPTTFLTDHTSYTKLLITSSKHSA